MKNWVSCALTFLFILTSNFESLSSSQAPIELTLSLDKKEIVAKEDLDARLKLHSNSQTPIIVPAQALYGYIQSGQGFFRIQLQKKAEGKYIDMLTQGTIDYLPEIDVDSLHKNDYRNYTLSMYMYFHFLKGQYRIRIEGAFSMWNKEKDVYSNWVYFNCPKELSLRSLLHDE